MLSRKEAPWSLQLSSHFSAQPGSVRARLTADRAFVRSTVTVAATTLPLQDRIEINSRNYMGMQMSFISRALGLGLATWAVTRVVRGVRGHKRQRQPEAMTRWEGEGGAIQDTKGSTQMVRSIEESVRP
jgi:hypothetical protein